MSSQFETSKLPTVPHGPPTRRSVGWILAGVAGLVLLAPVAGALWLQTADLGRFAKPICAAVRKATGRELSIGNGPIVRMSLPLSIVVENVALSNAPWGTRREMLRVRRVELKLRVLPLLLGRIAVQRLTLVGPDLLVETDPGGNGNWVLAAVPLPDPSGREHSGSLPLSRVTLPEVRVTGAMLAYHDGCGGWQAGVAVPSLRVSPSWKGAGRLDVDGTLAFGGAKISVSGIIGAVGTSGADSPFAVKMKFSTTGASADLGGSVRRIADLAGVDLGLGVEISDGPAFGALLGVPLPKLSPCRLDFRLRDSGPGWALESLHAAVGGSSVSGTAGYVFGCPRSRITIDLRGGSVDLRELSGTGAKTPPERPAHAAPGAKVFPAEPLRLDALNAVDATVSLRLENVRLPSGTQVRSLEAGAVVASGRLDVDRFSLALGGGRISGSLHVRSGRSSGFEAKVEGDGVALAALLGAAGTSAGVEGAATDLAVTFSGNGSPLHEWMASLDGKVRVVVGPGSFESRALALGGDVLTQALAAVHPDRGGASRTELRCAVVNVPVSAGVMRLDDRVAAETSRFNLAVSGSVNLGTEALDLDLRSRATQGLGLGLANLATLARVRGPLSAPSLTLDPKDALETAYSVRSVFKTRGRSLVQDQVRQRVFPDSPCTTALREGAQKRRSLLDLLRRW